MAEAGRRVTKPGRRVAEPGRRVAVTGIGCVTAAGEGVEGLWAGLHREDSGVAAVRRFDASAFRTRIAAEVTDFRPEERLGAKRARRVDRYSALALCSAAMALEDGALDPGAIQPERAAVQMGTALGGVEYAEEQHAAYVENGIRGVNPLLALSVFGGAASCNIAIEFGFTGPNSTNSMSCASGAMAIGEAFRIIRAGEADVALAGGAEAPLSPLTFGAFALIRAMSTRNDAPGAACRPFDAARDGFVMGEGACVLLLEEMGRALRRDAHVYGEVCGYGRTNDAWHMTAPRPGGTEAARAMRLALADATVGPGSVDYVNAHGSSTPLNDSTEAEAVRAVFDGRADGPRSALRVSATKAYYGHTLGASGAIEAAITLLGLRRDWLAPSLNLEQPGEGCELRFVPPGGEAFQAEYALSNSFGFGGVNAALLLRRPEG